LLPRAYSNAGEVQAILARSPNAPTNRRREDWLQARDSFLKSVKAWEQVQRQGDGPNPWAADLDRARAEVKRCATAAAAIR
jgi:hypothetical protein